MNMKKTYINPSIEVVKIKKVGMLAGSPLQDRTPAEVNGDGNYNSLGRYFDFDDEDEE